MLEDTQIVKLVYPTHHHFSSISPGTREHHHGCTEQEVLPRSRVGTGHASTSAHLQTMGMPPPPHRSFCCLAQCPLPSILFQSGAGMWIYGGWSPHNMGMHHSFMSYSSPLPLLFRILCKIQEDQANVILIAPTWPQQVWYTYLLHQDYPPTPFVYTWWQSLLFTAPWTVILFLYIHS